MRITAASTIIAGVIPFIVGCAGGSSDVHMALPAISARSNDAAAGARDPSGVAPQFLQRLRLGFPASSLRPNVGRAPTDLAVSDLGSGAVEILDNTYHLEAAVTTGLHGPDGDWYDDKGNLYVANYLGPNVTEYDKHDKLIFTYSKGLGDPINVTTDLAGNVYVADFASDGNGFIAEYPQGSNTMSAQCFPGTPAGVQGIAIDNKDGDVFVEYDNLNISRAQFAVYKHGLQGCKKTQLAVTVASGGGLQIDKNDNLAACDQNVGVDIIPPPYTTIKSTITGASETFHDALNKQQNLIFIADPNNAVVLVDKYPSGVHVATLSSANGLTDPGGVAAYPVGKK